MSPEYPIIDQPIGRIFTLLGKGYLQLLREKLSQLDIDRYYYALLLIHSHNGNITQQQLAALLDSDKVSVVRIIDYLAEKGYVQRRKLQDDKRKHCLLLTGKALEAMPHIKKAITEMNEIALFWFNNEQVNELHTMLKKVKQNINTYKTPK